MTRAAPLAELIARASATGSVQAAELRYVQSGDHDDEDEDGEDRGHGNLQLCNGSSRPTAPSQGACSSMTAHTAPMLRQCANPEAPASAPWLGGAWVERALRSRLRLGDRQIHVHPGAMA